MKIALAQINPTVGELQGNGDKIIDFAQRAHARGAELVVFPEFCITGYPPLDLLDNFAFIQSVEHTITRIAGALPAGLGAIVGTPVRNRSRFGKRLFNAALLLEDGQVVAEVHKTLLPTYDVFDEYRYCEPGHERRVVEWHGRRIGLHICEDMWNAQERAGYHLYPQNPVAELAAQGIDLFVNISASPFSVGKHELRNDLMGHISREYNVPFIMVNQVGANTEIIFDGDSRVHDAHGNLLACAPRFEEALIIWDSETLPPCPAHPRDDVRDLHDALVLGIRDYFEKSGFFMKALIGLSGGIDSAVTAALAVEALGAERVVGVTMPSKYSSSGSVSDSEALALAMGITFYKIPIVPAVEAFDQMLAPIFVGTPPGIAEENIQARSRGVTLMAISNKFDYLLLSTGNKSEMAVGYATLYGDMNGGLAVLADVFKVQVYEIARYINQKAGREVIPQSTIDKAPSAELRPGQLDQDSLPPYPILDRVLQLYVEELHDLDAIVEQTGFDRALVLDVLRKVDRNEYKRRQAPPGLRVSGKAFGIGRRLPIVMHPPNR